MCSHSAVGGRQTLDRNSVLRISKRARTVRLVRGRPHTPKGSNTMNTRSILSMAAIAGLGLTLVPSIAPAQQKSLKDQIVGTWTLVSWVQTLKDGSKNLRFGNDPKGVNTFTPDGQFTL